MKPLAGKVVLLTGASRGLGVDMAKAFAEKGARLSLAARTLPDLEKTRASLQSEAICVEADMRSLDSMRALIERTESELGPIDVLVNNAGVEQVCDYETMPMEQMEQILEVNLLGLMRLTRLVLPKMVDRRSGHIVNISSLAGLNAVPHNAAYSASKHGVVGFSRSLRAEMADHGIGVSVVCPGFVDAGMFPQWGRKPPRGLAEVSSASVAKATVRAVERNEPVVAVGKGLARIGHWVGVITPRFSEAAARSSGFTEFMREQARITADKR